MRQKARVDLPNIMAIAVSPDKSTIVASVKEGNSVQLKTIKEVEGVYGVQSTLQMPSTKAPGRNLLQFSKDGKLIFATDQEFLVVVDALTFEIEAQVALASSIANNPALGHCVAVHPTLPLVAVSANNTVFLYIYTEGFLTRTYITTFGTGITALTFDEAGNYLIATANTSGAVYKAPVLTNTGVPTLGSIASITGRSSISGGVLVDNRIVSGRASMIEAFGTPDNWASMSANLSVDRVFNTAKLAHANQKSVLVETDGAIHVLDRWTLETKYAMPVASASPIVSAF